MMVRIRFVGIFRFQNDVLNNDLALAGLDRRLRLRKIDPLLVPLRVVAT